MDANPTITLQAKSYYLKKVDPSLTVFDPHLQEVMLAKQAGQPPNPTITCTRDGKLTVDVIAHLDDPQSEVEGLTLVRRIGDIATGSVEVARIPEVRERVKSMKAATEMYPNMYRSVPEIEGDAKVLKQAFEPRGFDGSGVIVGVVDYDCDFAHDNFRTAAGASRILWLWDQRAGQPATALPPVDFGYGREFSGEAIAKALAAEKPYEALGYRPQPGAHGTFVLDVAAGNGRADHLPYGKPDHSMLSAKCAPAGVAPGASLVFVHLADSGGALGNSCQLLEAVSYIFAKADALQLPAVVNLSLATTGGPHDGTTLVEQGFERLLEKPGRMIVIAAGNSYEMRSHKMGTVTPQVPVNLKWQTDPQAKKNEAEVWYEGEVPLQVILVSPDGVRLGPVGLGTTADLWLGNERRGRISHRKNDPSNGAHQIDVRVPTPPGGTVEAWTIELSAAGGSVPFHSWIEQDDQGEARFLNGSTSTHTLGSICCGPSTLAVGAYMTNPGGTAFPLWERSSSGPTRDGRTDKPEVSAPGVNIIAARSTGGTTTMSGTSMAAPHVSGLVALLFQAAKGAGELASSRQIRDAIGKTARRNPPEGPRRKDPRYGAGRVSGLAALQLLRSARPRTAPGARPTAGFGSPGARPRGDGISAS